MGDQKSMHMEVKAGRTWDFLGETQIAKWLEDNASSFGILQDYGYAKRFCSHK